MGKKKKNVGEPGQSGAGQAGPSNPQPAGQHQQQVQPQGQQGGGQQGPQGQQGGGQQGPQGHQGGRGQQGQQGGRGQQGQQGGRGQQGQQGGRGQQGPQGHQGGGGQQGPQGQQGGRGQQGQQGGRGQQGPQGQQGQWGQQGPQGQQGGRGQQGHQGQQGGWGQQGPQGQQGGRGQQGHQGHQGGRGQQGPQGQQGQWGQQGPQGQQGGWGQQGPQGHQGGRGQQGPQGQQVQWGQQGPQGQQGRWGQQGHQGHQGGGGGQQGHQGHQGGRGQQEPQGQQGQWGQQGHQDGGQQGTQGHQGGMGQQGPQGRQGGWGQQGPQGQQGGSGHQGHPAQQVTGGQQPRQGPSAQQVTGPQQGPPVQQVGGGPQDRPQQAPGPRAPPQQAMKPGRPEASRDPTPAPSSASSDSGSVSSSKLRSYAAADVKNMPSIELLQIKTKKAIETGNKKGRKIRVAVNHMPLTMRNYNLKVVHYDVLFDPDKPKFLLRPAIAQFFQDNFKGKVPIFDGNKNLYSNGYLRKSDGSEVRSLTSTVTVFNEESQRDKEIMVTIAPAREINMQDLQLYQKQPGVNVMMALTVLDVAMRCSLAYSNKGLVQSGRKFFSEPARPFGLGNGVDLWHGSFQAAVLGWKPYVNIDITHKGFYASYTIPDLIQFFEDEARNDRSNRRFDLYAKLDSHLKGLRVDYQIPNQPTSKRTYRVNGVVGIPSKESFTDDSGRTRTVANYYQVDRKCPLRMQNVPCLWVGSRDRKIYIPGELCRISPGQPHVKKLNELQTSNMVKNATCNTDERRYRIMETFKSTGLANSENPCLKEFGISIAGQFEEVEGRILDAPGLQYKGRTLYPDRGQWRADKFLQEKQLVRWAILSLSSAKPDQLYAISREFARGGHAVGMEIQEAAVVKNIPQDHNMIKNFEAFLNDMKKQGMQLVVVVVPDSGPTYAKVKTSAEICVGVLTQCIKSKTLYKLNGATVGNILLKVNAKLNGTNHEITRNADRPQCFSRPFMVVGADVTHASPGQSNIPSVAAVVASFDSAATRYNPLWRMQPKGEIIRDLEEMMRTQLLHFASAANGKKPEKIIFYRDGVSEGEIQYVMSQEIGAIRNACRKLEQGYEPKITFVVVQKRHHTRFFPTNKRDIYDQKNFNLPAGTIIDTQIVHPFETEFLLLSHASILGTARPTKYRLVHDDSDFSEEELEKLTYYLCHLYSRCTRTVSYPTPTYYAHLQAFRARHYLDADPVRDMGHLAKEQSRRNTPANDSFVKTSPMFFV